jgi:signal transduction histidine kinase
MRRSLTLKWIATLLLTSLVGVALVGLFAYRTTVSEYDRLRTEQSKDAFLEDVTAYYQANQSWQGLDLWWMSQNGEPDDDLINVPNNTANGVPVDVINDMPPEPVRRAPPQLFALADAADVIVFGFGPFEIGDKVSPEMIAEGTPIMIDGERVGTALLAVQSPQLDPREQSYLNRTYEALLIGAIGAGATALLIGVLLSRYFLRPLAELTTAITAMRQGDLNQQVQVRTQDELGILAQAFNQMSAEIHHANQLRKQMTADIAHDLRTPLMVISGYIEALRDKTFQPTPERFEAMNQEAILLMRLVEDLRTLSLADAGELKLMVQSIQPGELLEQVRQSFEPIAVERQVTLKVEADSELPDLQLDRERMVEAMANLVNNALYYTPSGGSVTLQARKREDDVQLAVSDTGEGIPQDKLSNIFERFYRTDESRQQNGESGLGLAIAKSIIEAHHGTIMAESILGRGTTMIVTLPQNNA